MNAFELHALRRIFDMTIAECATYITQDNNSTAWQRWEAGEATIPPEIIARLMEIKAKRQRRINAIIDKINHRIGNNTMRYFSDLHTFQSVYTEGDFIDWKIYQSVAAELFAHDLERLC
ncbi:TPA: YdiL family protein [Salmonella enterica]|nr:YdiL family protein [Salmonella enterica]